MPSIVTGTAGGGQSARATGRISEGVKSKWCIRLWQWGRNGGEGQYRPPSNGGIIRRVEGDLSLVLDTLKRLQRDRKITMVLVSHDLGVIRTMADRVMVMRHGEVVEQGLADQVFQDPQHSYTQQLVHAKL